MTSHTFPTNCIQSWVFLFYLPSMTWPTFLGWLYKLCSVSAIWAFSLSQHHCWGSLFNIQLRWETGLLHSSWFCTACIDTLPLRLQRIGDHWSYSTASHYASYQTFLQFRVLSLASNASTIIKIWFIGGSRLIMVNHSRAHVKWNNTKLSYTNVMLL